jgi:hypothetical protein
LKVFLLKYKTNSCKEFRFCFRNSEHKEKDEVIPAGITKKGKPYRFIDRVLCFNKNAQACMKVFLLKYKTNSCKEFRFCFRNSEHKEKDEVIPAGITKKGKPYRFMRLLF